MNKKVWFRTLSHFERSLVSLTIRVVDEVRSSRLSGILSCIMLKLENALESTFLKKALEEGNGRAVANARLACSWGNRTALSWARDRAYVLFLGISSMNALEMFRCPP